MFLCPVDDNEVFNMLNKLDKSKSSGPNSIPTNLLKNQVHDFVLPLKLAINSLSQKVNFLTYSKLLKYAQFSKKGKEIRPFCQI